MKYYEILYIVNPNLEQTRLDEVKKEVSGEVSKLLSAGIINHRIFGKKRLAYHVEKHKYGTYMILHIETEDSTKLPELSTYFKLHKSIIRHLIVKLDEKPEEDLSPEVEAAEDGKAGKEATKEEKPAEAKPEVETAEEQAAEDGDAEPAKEEEPVAVEEETETPAAEEDNSPKAES